MKLKIGQSIVLAEITTLYRGTADILPSKINHKLNAPNNYWGPGVIENYRSTNIWLF